jgi:uncharacterized protein YyaL (SSP411 family)
MEGKGNRLGGEKSPYLRQHAHNPVWWHAWGSDAFDEARGADRPIFLSIGYSACHWCHVMERESFEDERIASLLNRHFIAVKVDREELPDVDGLYMNAVQAMGQRGGWPLSVFLTPDLKPFFGGTYFPKPQFEYLLTELSRLWTAERAALIEQAKALHDFLLRPYPSAAEEEVPGDELFRAAFRAAEFRFDRAHGGFGAAPKFPPSMLIRLLLRIHHRTRDERPLAMAESTLLAMARGGIYDHLGGGFARYSTDERWLVPHFEKMLYDNALLAAAYAEVYQLTGKALYAEVARETLDYMLRDLSSPDGAFYSAEDADSGGVEGAYYVWKYDELASVLDEDEFEGARRVFGLSPGGNFEDGASVLALQPGVPWEERDTPVIAALRRRLLDLRAEKERPRRDEKVLTSWNALAIEALCRGYRALGDGRYLDAALRAAEFIKANLYRDGVLYRRYMEGDVRHGGTLDDYAYTIQGFITLYESTFDSGWLGLAARLQETQNELFADEAGGYHYTSRDAEHLIARVKDFFDGAMPNSNAVSALNLLRLHRLTRDEDHLGRAFGVFGASAALMRAHPSAFSQMLIALDFHLAPPFEAVIAGEPSSGEFIRTAGTLRRRFSPSLVIAAGDEGVPMAGGKQLHGKALIYLCRDTACDAPTADVRTVLAALDGVNRYSLDE